MPRLFADATNLFVLFVRIRLFSVLCNMTVLNLSIVEYL